VRNRFGTNRNQTSREGYESWQVRSA